MYANITVLDCINPIKVVVFLTFAFALFRFEWIKPNNRYVFFILGVSLILEIVNSILVMQHIKLSGTMTVGAIFHNGLWLALLARNSYFKRTIYLSLVLYIIFSIVNWLTIEGSNGFNYYTFVVGAFLYLFFFIVESFYRLSKEDFAFLLANEYRLLLAPILLFLGLSFMFGFKSKAVTSTMLLPNVKLYDAIVYFVNIIYYLLMNIYIYHERKSSSLVSQPK